MINLYPLYPLTREQMIDRRAYQNAHRADLWAQVDAHEQVRMSISFACGQSNTKARAYIERAQVALAALDRKDKMGVVKQEYLYPHHEMWRDVGEPWDNCRD